MRFPIQTKSSAIFQKLHSNVSLLGSNKTHRLVFQDCYNASPAVNSWARFYRREVVHIAVENKKPNKINAMTAYKERNSGLNYAYVVHK